MMDGLRLETPSRGLRKHGHLISLEGTPNFKSSQTPRSLRALGPEFEQIRNEARRWPTRELDDVI